MKLPIPVIDLFAGPGGLGEGFSGVTAEDGRPAFRIALSIEKDAAAHKTLLLRSFFRQFRCARVPDDYYEYLRGELTREELFARHTREAEAAKNEAWLATLGTTPPELVRRRIHDALNGAQLWVLIGGPPCQAYSLVGRSRMRTSQPAEFESDERHFLYREYLRIIADHSPPVFVLENVKGLLSSSVGGEKTFERICKDLSQPPAALNDTSKRQAQRLAYTLVPLTGRLRNGEPPQPIDFVIRSEEFGIPQSRHRVILLGVRRDFCSEDSVMALASLSRAERTVSISEVIADLPRVRSGVSGGDGRETWRQTIEDGARELVEHSKSLGDSSDAIRIAKRIRKVSESLAIPRHGCGASFVRGSVAPSWSQAWYVDPRLGGVCNHHARRHMASDLHRYLFAACYAALFKRSPQLKDFPAWLLPAHKNAKQGVSGSMFSDRFRVQLKGVPGTTVTSHISKDGHYYIHYDARQCRSLTVREAARVQTFPDNYLFEGTRTQQYAQVGNAVPPLLAFQIAEGVLHLLATVDTNSERSAKTQYGRNGQTPHRGRAGRHTVIPRSSKA